MSRDKSLKKSKTKQSSKSKKINILNKPLKSPACKGCPALKKGICKCARKRAK